MAEALYRKYRPQIFEDVVGQEHIERTIKNAIEQDKVSHAYLFTGPRGTGKTTTARLLAKALLCECGPTPEPDGTCDDCVMIANGEHPDVYELDAASRTGVENVREEIIGRVQFAPTRGRYKIYIIDEVHMLSTAAFNALLKTLEEPPSHVVFILATTDPQKVPETIHSRCQRFDFRRISAESIVSRLGAICVSEDVEFEGEALDLIAHRAEGGMRNALTSLEQLIAFGEGKVTMEVAERLLGSIDTNDLAEIVRAIGTRDVASCFRWTAEYVETGADLAQFVRDLAEHMRNMYVLSLAGADVALEVSETVRRELASELPLFGPDRLARLLGVLGDLSAELKTSTNPRLSFEIALTRMVRPDSDLTLEALAERIEALESGHSAVAHVIGGGAAAVAAPQVAAASAPQVSVAPAPASPPASPATQGAPMPASQPSAAPASAPGPDRASSAERAGAVPAAPVQPVAAPQVAAPSREAGGVPPQGAEGVSAPRPASPVTQSQAPSAAAPSDQLKASLQNPAALQRVWQAVLATLKKNKAAYGVLFLNTKAVYDAGKDTLIIEFPAENSFAFKAVQKPDVQEAVSVALNQACGESLHFAYAQGGAVATAAAPAARPAPSPTPRPTPAPAQRPQQPQQTAPAVSAPAPRPKPVPDYDIPPYEDEVVPYDDGYVSSAPTPAPAPDPASAPTPAAVPAPAAPAPVDARTSATPEPAVQQSPEELQAILAAGFGDGVRVEEVRE
ncbi:DNA polymerase III subunit gamma/tau [Eggerthella lenta]|uniref:DNA polymerase III subunit gamma/tau n=1 Tax=Eggerthella lenta (strain ATCC 25559 / DSM 2243 / CCUG 17323 / JCM 9979 / KCTC 3265 / NCTC 11813 / VPI 0255 / 1899 B) TaxID=479437 RepID=C8WM34_EGGLE|nr:MULTISPECIES: DNA polymerase III subunit gamma/tau [Eggerthella]ACV54588.1 DNA polymerase III, subunits gamma and tau [Eggerthella lenta DSM 2243]MCG4517187.1 DNA polymerase III subunit gamma/tau [Eggerthella lenta]MDB1746416.1 DNA polymerase III subunit gamma/tau [Eggerthella lenta]MDU5903099.1 DNA polymerase III subunit gamma/tau [Eggerthella sp.]MDU5981295.1 DNA polymerase III subunit gamma/tau [Eggerthella sp.]